MTSLKHKKVTQLQSYMYQGLTNFISIFKSLMPISVFLFFNIIFQFALIIFQQFL